MRDTWTDTNKSIEYKIKIYDHQYSSDDTHISMTVCDHEHLQILVDLMTKYGKRIEVYGDQR